MKTFTPTELLEILRKHDLYLRNKDCGEYANLRDTDLSHADLSGANLRDADLSGVKEDFTSKLLVLKPEVSGLYKAVMDGRIDGSTYTGECACFVGTIANNMGVNRSEIGISPDSESLTEKFFLAIAKGDTPENNPASLVIKDWLEEFMSQESIKIPLRSILWSEE